MQIQNRELYDPVMAAKRVKRHRRTIYRWILEGMPFRQIGGHRYIEHEVLLAWYRAKLKARREHRARHDRGGRWVSVA